VASVSELQAAAALTSNPGNNPLLPHFSSGQGIDRQTNIDTRKVR